MDVKGFRQGVFCFFFPSFRFHLPPCKHDCPRGNFPLFSEYPTPPWHPFFPRRSLADSGQFLGTVLLWRELVPPPPPVPVAVLHSETEGGPPQDLLGCSAFFYLEEYQKSICTGLLDTGVFLFLPK